MISAKLPPMILSRDNIHFILVRTQFASNLGSTVRVMKNMGFHNLVLVQPECEVGMEARSFAMRGAEILDRALFSPTLEEAAENLSFLVGTTGRFKGQKPRLITCRQLVEDVLSSCASANLGVVLGSEDNGLRREELRLCQWLVEIPTGSDYTVLNLAQAAAIVAYELNLGMEGRETSEDTLQLAGAQELESLLNHFRETVDLLSPNIRLSTNRLMQRVRKIASRAHLEREDINMLHLLLKELDRLIANRESKTKEER
jgi:TrmH family RNA methyltransferase